MPNTLVHIGIQTLLTQAACRAADLRLILLGCIIPDLPWIMRRLILVPLSHLYDYSWQPNAYILIQASFIFCLIFATVVAMFTRTPRQAFAILASGSLMHLLLDACQDKWGNGVLLFAPLSWKLTSFALVPIEGWLTVSLTLLGLTVIVLRCRVFFTGSLPLILPAKRRMMAGLGLLLLYLILPLFLFSGPWNADTNYLQTMELEEERAGKYVELDRHHLEFIDESPHIVSPQRPPIALVADIPKHWGRISVKGEFLTPYRLGVDQYRLHPAGGRDIASYLGLLFILLSWGWGLLVRWRRG